MVKHPAPRALVALFLAAVVVTPAAAQTTNDRPFRGLFGSAKSGRQQVALTVSVFEEYGSETGATSDQAFGIESPVTYQGLFTGIHSDLTFTRHDPGLTLSLRGGGTMRYYPELRRYAPVRYRGDMGLSAGLGPRRHTTVRIESNVEYTPYYRLSLLPDLPALLGDDSVVGADFRDDALFKQQAYIYNASINEEQRLSSRSSVFFSQGYRYADFTDGGPGVRDLRAGAGYSYRINRDVAVRMAYEYRRGTYGWPGQTSAIQTHNIDAGIDYQRALTHQTTFSFETGSSLMSNAVDRRQYRMVGSAVLRHRMARGWAVNVEYRRGLELLEGAAQPFFSDTANLGLSGYIGRRVDLLASGGYSFGNIGFGQDRYQHVQGSFRVRMALSRYLAMDAQYLYYHHDLGAVFFFPQFPPRIDRQAVRVNMTLWLPFVR
jgi:hypothetical protein